MNKKTFLLVLLICGLFLAALSLRNGRLLLLAVPFLVYLMVGVLQAPGETALSAVRSIDKLSGIAGEPVEMQVVIENQGAELVNLLIKDKLHHSMTVLEGQEQSRLSLTPGEATKLDYKFKAARGVYTWKTIQVCASDPFGLFEYKREVPAFGELLVLPAPMKTRTVMLNPRHTMHAPGPTPARLAGSGTDFWGVREYRSGDPLAQVNWRLKARHPHKLFTNEYEREEIADFGLILDTRKLSSACAVEEALFEYSVSGAMSLAESFLKNGNRVSLLVYGKPISSVFPGYGKKHLHTLQRNLAHARLGEYIPFSYLAYFPTRLFPARSVIVIFSRVHCRDLEVYARLRSFGYDVLLISPDPVEYTSQRLPSSQINSLAVRLARVERVVQLKQLLQLGVKVVDWQVDKPLETVIHESVNRLAQRRNIQLS
jgi:uncharacterized protein (DUF58 family)